MRARALYVVKGIGVKRAEVERAKTLAPRTLYRKSAFNQTRFSVTWIRYCDFGSTRMRVLFSSTRAVREKGWLKYSKRATMSSF